MSKLQEIFAHKQVELAERKSKVSSADLKEKCRDLPPTRGFLRALQNSRHPVSLIAEVKKASPSEGVIRADFDPCSIALGYKQAGADCLSVLTDEKFFQGATDYLVAIRDAVGIPLLRKDFTADEYHLYEARAMGADAILLIVAGLTDSQLSEFHETANSIDLDALVEVHNEEELERALRFAPPLIGINNRDLSTFVTDLATTQRLAKQVPPGTTLVSESGLENFEQVQSVQKSGARAVLIGTTFMRSPEPGAKAREVMGW